MSTGKDKSAEKVEMTDKERNVMSRIAAAKAKRDLQQAKEAVDREAKRKQTEEDLRQFNQNIETGLRIQAEEAQNLRLLIPLDPDREELYSFMTKDFPDVMSCKDLPKTYGFRPDKLAIGACNYADLDEELRVSNRKFLRDADQSEINFLHSMMAMIKLGRLSGGTPEMENAEPARSFIYSNDGKIILIP